MEVAVVGVLCTGVIAVLIVVVVMASAATRRRERERQALLQAWAAHHRWSYVVRPAVDWAARLPGRNRTGVTLVLTGTVWSRRISVAEYHYTETSTTHGTDASGNSTTSTTSHTHHYIVTVAHLDRPRPSLAVHPRGGLSKLGRTLFGDGATATGDPEFDRRFQVRGDAAAARHLVTPAIRAAHLAGSVPAWSVHNTELLVYRAGRLTDPNAIPDLAAPVARVADLLP